MIEKNDKEVRSEGKSERFDWSVVVLSIIFISSTIWFLDVSEGFSALAVIEAVFYGTMQTLVLIALYGVVGGAIPLIADIFASTSVARASFQLIFVIIFSIFLLDSVATHGTFVVQPFFSLIRFGSLHDTYWDCREDWIFYDEGYGNCER